MRRATRKHIEHAFAMALAVIITLIVTNITVGERRLKTPFDLAYGVEDPQFLRSLDALLGTPLKHGNVATELLNGDQIFPSMLAAVRGARKSITFETYIYWTGAIGRELADALSERARAGVRVLVVLDWLGSEKIDDAYLVEMRRAGVEVRKFHPLAFYDINRMNNRTHRKLLVVDGRVGFTGGVGIADKWSGHAQDAGHWRDTHVKIEGPAVAGLQGAFAEHWLQITSEVLDGDAFFPPLDEVGGALAQVVSSSPTDGATAMRLLYAESIAAARRRIVLASAYFVPDDVAVEMLARAARRGVRVDVLVPGPVIDTETTRRASRSRWGEILTAGVNVYEFQPTMCHVKLLVVDERWVVVGSTNFDERSFRLNDESSLAVYDEAFAKRQVDVFDQDLARSRRVSLDEWTHRSLGEKVLDTAAGWLAPQL